MIHLHSARSITSAIQWYEGMLLSPQQFQQMTLRQESLLHYQVSLVSPFHWGVRTLEFDKLLLFSGKLRITDLEAVLPDGLVVFHPHPEGETLELDLMPFVEEAKNQPVTVHLVIPARREGVSLVRGDLARYDSIAGDPVSDENTGEGELEIPRLKPRLSLILTDAPPQKYVAIPLARIQYKNEAFSLTDYVPPLLNVFPSSQIGAMCAQIARRLREKAVSLSEKAHSPAMTYGSPLVQETKQQVQSIVGALPQFEALLSVGGMHPFPLYMGLCQIAGSLASLGAGLVPPIFPPYNHNDLLATFDVVREYITRMMSEGILESHAAIPFVLEGNAFGVRFDRSWMKKTVCIGVRGQSGMSEKETIAWVEASLIGSKTKIQQLREKRILGAPRKRIDRDEELVPGRGTMLYDITISPEFIEADEILQITNAQSALRPSEIVLYVRTE